MRLPVRKKTLLRISALLLLLFVLYLEPWSWMFGQPAIRVSPQTTNIVTPLTADGHVDYVAALNAKYSKDVTPENNALVVFASAWGPRFVDAEIQAQYFQMLGIQPPPLEGQYLHSQDAWIRQLNKSKGVEDDDNLNAMFDEAERRPWSTEEFPDVARWLQQNQAALELVVAGSKRPRFFEPLVGDTILKAPMQSINWMRSSARGLAARIMLRLHAKQPDAAIDDVLAMFRLAQLFETQSPGLVAPLCGTAIHNMALDTLAKLSYYGNLSPQQCRDLRQQLAGFNRTLDLVDRIDQDDRWNALDSVQFIEQLESVPSGNPRDPAPPPGAAFQRKWNHATIDWNEGLLLFNQWCDRSVEACREPDRSTRRAAVKQVADDLAQAAKDERNKYQIARLSAGRGGRGRTWGLYFSVMFYPAIDTIDQCLTDILVRTNMAELMLALAEHRAERGEYPKTLAEIAPQYLATVPKDIFGGGDFHYQRTADGYRLYSIGKNERDDGGDRTKDICDDIIYEFPVPPPKKTDDAAPGDNR